MGSDFYWQTILYFLEHLTPSHKELQPTREAGLKNSKKASGWLFLIFLFGMDYGVGQIEKPSCKISSWPGPSSWFYRKYQADPVNSAQRETASSCQSISTHRASPAIAKRNSNHPRSHFLIPGNRWSIVITQRCSHVQHAWKSVSMQNIFLQRRKLTLLAC